MATVTMDISEHEALKENIRLLKESKTRERELSNEIKKLQQEAIDKLVDAEKSVTIINKTIKQESLYVEKNPYDIVQALKYVVGNDRYGRSRLIDYDSHDSIVERLKEAFFTIDKKETIIDNSVTTKGFDEVRKEVEEKYLKEFSSDTQKELDRIPFLENQIKELNKVNLELGSKNTELLDIKDKFEKTEVESAINRNKVAEASLKIARVNSILKLNWNMFNYGSMKEKVERAITNQKMTDFIKNHDNSRSF